MHACIKFAPPFAISVRRLGHFASIGYALDGGAPSGPQQLALSDLVGLCRSRISGMAPKQLAEVVWALAQVCVLWGGFAQLCGWGWGWGWGWRGVTGQPGVGKNSVYAYELCMLSAIMGSVERQWQGCQMGVSTEVSSQNCTTCTSGVLCVSRVGWPHSLCAVHVLCCAVCCSWVCPLMPPSLMS
jgi:hypothetical protein